MKILHISQNEKYKNFFKSICNNYEYVYIEHKLELINNNIICKMTYEEVFNYWNKYYIFFYTFDIVILDNCLMSKIFLMNNYSKKLIIYVSLDFDNYLFDDYFCDLFNSINNKKNITVLIDTEYTNYFLNEIKNVKIFSQNIEPIYKEKSNLLTYNDEVSIDSKDKIYVLNNDNEEFNIKKNLKTYNVFLECVNNFDEILDGYVIYIPKEWTDLNLFKLIQDGIIYFIPTETFLKELLNEKTSLFRNYNENFLQISEWYMEKNDQIFIYFNSWNDLNNKLNLEIDNKKECIKTFSKKLLKKNEYYFQDIFNTSLFKIYYINLEKREDRNEKMLKILQYFNKYNIIYERIEAINGNEIKQNELKYIFGKEYYKNKKLTNGQIGCILSHIKAIQQFYDSNKKYGIIFEDDICINEKYSEEILPNTFKYLENNYFDICYFGMNALGGSQLYIGEEISPELYKLKNFGYGAHGYVISKNGARKMLNYYENIKVIEPYDYLHEITKRYKKIFNDELHIICVKPDFIYYNDMNLDNFKCGKEFLIYQNDINDSDTR